jgi:hypothetical protein
MPPKSPSNQESVTQEAPPIPDDAVVETDKALSVPEPDSDKDKTPAAAEPKEGEGTKSPESATGDKKPRRDRSSERRIKGLLKTNSDQERAINQTLDKLDQANQKIAELEKQLSAKPEPQLDDYASPKDYAKAYAQWVNDSSAPPKTPEPSLKQPTPKAEDLPDQITPEDQQAFTARGQEKLGDDFLKAMDMKDVAISPVMGRYVMDSDTGPELYVHLTENPDLAKEIYFLSPTDAIKELIEIEKELAAEGADQGEKDMNAVDKQISKAPPAPTDTDFTSAPASGKSLDEMTMEEYSNYRHKEMARDRGKLN